MHVLRAVERVCDLFGFRLSSLVSVSWVDKNARKCNINLGIEKGHVMSSLINLLQLHEELLSFYLASSLYKEEIAALESKRSNALLLSTAAAAFGVLSNCNCS